MECGYVTSKVYCCVCRCITFNVFTVCSYCFISLCTSLKQLLRCSLILLAELLVIAIAQVFVGVTYNWLLRSRSRSRSRRSHSHRSGSKKSSHRSRSRSRGSRSRRYCLIFDGRCTSVHIATFARPGPSVCLSVTSPSTAKTVRDGPMVTMRNL